MGLAKTRKTGSLISQLLLALPEGVAVPSAWLLAHGISPQLVRKYVASGWLVPLVRGVYARPAFPVGWQGVVLGLQRLAQRPVHVGGLSALNLQNLAHYLPLGGESSIHLWNDTQPACRPGRRVLIWLILPLTRRSCPATPADYADRLRCFRAERQKSHHYEFFSLFSLVNPINCYHPLTDF